MQEENNPVIEEIEKENMEIIDQLEQDHTIDSEEEANRNLKETFKKIFDPKAQKNEEKEHEEELYVKKNSKTRKKKIHGAKK